MLKTAIDNTIAPYTRAENFLNETSFLIEKSIQNAQNEVYTEGILPEIRSLINEQLNPSYDNRLSISKTQGITGNFESKYEIPTSSKNKLNRLLKIMPNGSIGIAGPRGAGKSTLIHSFCSGWIEKFKDKPVVALMTSAPVDYEPRDFLLHIFSSVCKKVLDLNGEESQNYIVFSGDFQKSTFLPKNLFTTDGLVSISLVAIILFFLKEIDITFSNKNPFITFESSKSTISFLIAVILIFLVCLILFYPTFKKSIYKKMYQKKDENKIVTQTEIVRQAKQNIQIIKFQSSFSSGWSGALSFPFGIKGGISSAAMLSQNQLSLPEIVEKYCDFIELLSSEYEIIIGIDELDKISSSNKAHRFLNEIKGIFNLKNCYYLISVSENAISSFNKRGMPFRDAFDSSFDDIISVNHLDFKSSKELIRRRVIGMSVPFMCLCYLMSGGLARDLIRICRDLVEFHEQEPKKDNISSLSKEIIKKDIMSKISAMKIDGKKSSNAENGLAQEMIEKIYQLENSLETKSTLWTCCLDLMSVPERSLISSHDEQNENHESNFLKVQVGTYLYYVITVMDFFEKEHDKPTFEKLENSDMFDNLAKAHYFIGLCPKLAEKIVTDFRRENGMITNQPNQNQLTDIKLAQQMNIITSYNQA
jgi:hypothetical protein